jgi:glutathione S-transferase
MLELWHEWNSVHSFKVRVVLAAKELAWTERRIELLKFDHLRPEYLKLNPNGVVPTLLHDGRVVVESSVICQYLDECFPDHRLLPDDAYGRARARTWLKYFDDVLHPAIRAASFQLLYRPLIAAMPSAVLEARLATHPDPRRAQAFRAARGAALDEQAVHQAKEVFRSAIALIEADSPAPWLTGAQFGLADAAMAPFAERSAHLGMESLWNESPRALAWRKAVLSLPAVIKATAPPAYRFPGPPD